MPANAPIVPLATSVSTSSTTAGAITGGGAKGGAGGGSGAAGGGGGAGGDINFAELGRRFPDLAPGNIQVHHITLHHIRDRKSVV